ncbi:MAG: hypothetical protein WAR37_04600 [Candidatus Microsaccharimonas sp.]
MDFERVIPQVTRQVDADKLVKYCQRFANILSNKTWFFDSTIGTHSQREIKRVAVLTESLGSTKYQSAQTMTVKVDFWADKDEVGFNADGQADEYEAHYKLGVSLGTEVSATELPTWVIESLAMRPLFQKKRDISEIDTAFDVIDDPDKNIELDWGAVDAFIYDKKMVMHYAIDDEGYLEDFGITCLYECNGQYIDHREYSWSENVIEAVYEDPEEQEADEPNGSLNEQLTVDEIEAFIEQFDGVMNKILDENADDEIDEAFEFFESAETSGNSEENARMHYSRAFGILALNAANYIGMRIK